MLRLPTRRTCASLTRCWSMTLRGSHFPCGLSGAPVLVGPPAAPCRTSDVTGRLNTFSRKMMDVVALDSELSKWLIYK